MAVKARSRDHWRDALFRTYQVKRKCSVLDNFGCQRLVYFWFSEIVSGNKLYCWEDESFQFPPSLSSPNMPFHTLRSSDSCHHLKISSSDSQSSSIVLFILRVFLLRKPSENIHSVRAVHVQQFGHSSHLSCQQNRQSLPLWGFAPPHW